MCGIIGVISKARNVIGDGIVLLGAENHRGEQGCGAVAFDGARIRSYCGIGKVPEVFGPRDQKRWAKLTGSVCIMHCLYSTVGSKGDKEQPKTRQPVIFKFKGRRGAISHNGNLVRLDGLRREARRAGYKKFKSKTSDTEVIAALLSTSKKSSFLEALLDVLKKIEGKGSFSLVILYGGKLYGVRDQNGNRPLCIIKKNGKDGDNDSYILASESCVYPSLDATRFVRDVDMGELAVLGEDGIERSIKWTSNVRSAFCVCELIYFASPASRFFGKSAYTFRVKAGEISAKNHPVKADVVVPVPDSGRGYSEGFSSVSGIRSLEGYIKNRYAARTFMQPREISRGDQQMRKLQALPDVMEGKDVCCLEDSIFRASVAPMAVKMAREHGNARAVHMRVGSPPVKFPCHLGIDISTKKELAAATRTVAQIRDELIHSDSLAYLTVDEQKQALREAGFNPDDFCFGCFTGEYPVEPPKKK